MVKRPKGYVLGVEDDIERWRDRRGEGLRAARLRRERAVVEKMRMRRTTKRSIQEICEKVLEVVYWVSG